MRYRRNKARSKRAASYVYSIYDRRGRRKYVGSTNSPRRRFKEHMAAGKIRRGDSLRVESYAMRRRDAERLEARKIQGYRRRTGRLPRLNHTPDGQYRSYRSRKPATRRRAYRVPSAGAFGK